ncbi:gastricsin, aspartyl protease family A01A [Achlya hypogyna]|uniref:Gastricsin, aspartyl protease family A01A n=1 Tax=Achlya hypogyna TaxID=1202772 RepID=A0A1V9YF37_ACHHY|nr:gastricsin, aspartyl protease family A01A [Achlya hypogyna]
MALGLEMAAVAAVAVATVWLYIGFRAPSVRILFFSAMAWMKGVPIMWVDTPALAAKALKVSSTKGIFLERILSEPAWLPVISLESVDDPLWSEMKQRLVELMKLLPPGSDLQFIAATVTNEYLAAHNVLDSRGIVHITIASFYQWIFRRPFPPDAGFVCDSTWEWRKELALKGKASPALKQRVVQWTVQQVKMTPWLEELFGADWAKPEYYSLLLQPFFLSPAINVSDVAVTMGSLYPRDTTSAADIASLIHRALDVAHPFVIVERFLEHGLTVGDDVVIAPGTHVFIPMDIMTSDNTIRFGAGPRKCPGQHQGMALMLGIFQEHVLRSPKFQPALNHKYSGRDQDGQETLPELLYQVEVDMLRRALALLAGLAAAVTAADDLMRIPLLRRPKPAAAPIPGALSASAVTALGHVPLTNYVEFQFYGEIMVCFDTGSSDLWVPATECDHCAGTGRFARNQSSTFVLAADPNFTVAYGSGGARGIAGTETISIGGYTASEVPFGVVQREQASLSNMKADGLLGLAFDGLATISHPPAFMLLVLQNAGLAPQFAFYLTPEPNQEGSQLLLGGGDPAWLDGASYMTFDVVPQYGYWTFWRVQVHSLFIGNRLNACDSGCIAFIDTGTSLLGVPANLYAGVLDAIAQYATRAGCYCTLTAYGYQCYMCSNANFPPLRIGFGGTAYFVLTGADYTLCMGATCLVLIQPSGQDMWTIGDVFLKKFKSLYDVRKRTVGFLCPDDTPETCGLERDAAPRAFLDNMSLSAMDAHTILVLFVSGCSMLGSVFVVLTYYMYPVLQSKRVLVLLFYLSICHLVYNGTLWISALFQYNAASTGCALELVLQQFSGVGTLLLSAVISIELLRAVRGWQAQTKDYSGLYHTVIWCTCTLCGCITIWTGVLGYVPDSYGPSRACWAEHTPAWGRLTFFYVPVVCTLALALYAVVAALRRLRSTNLIQTESGRRSSRLLVSYVSVLAISLVVPTVVGLASLYTVIPESVSFVSELCFYAQGLLHGFVWACSPSFQQAYAQRYYMIGDEEVACLVAEMAYEYYLSAAVVVAAVSLYIGLRAPSVRTMLLTALAWLKGVPIVWVDSPALAAKVMKASTSKGVFIERIYGEPAWLPIVSLESVDEPQWSRMKANLMVLMKKLPSSQALQTITASVTDKYLAAHDVLDSQGVVYITVAAFYEWIFAKPFPEDAGFVCDSTWEWRKELALKGKGDWALKQRVVQWTVEQVKATPTIYEIFGDKWEEPEYFSLLLQPFFLSPAINVSDVAVTMGSLAQRGMIDDNIGDMINKALDMAHPFVIAERFLEKGLTCEEITIAPGTQVFIPMDIMTTDNVIRFGAGARKCPGQFQGTALMLGLFQDHVLKSPKFQPAVNHKYSGRDQDGQETFSELVYQAYIIGKSFYDAIGEALSPVKTAA